MESTASDRSTLSDPMRICVFSPSTLFTVTVEEDAGAGPEVHFHSGGQGLWIARMIASLGGCPVLCTPLGGESGTVLRSLISAEGIEQRPIRVSGANGGYVHVRRDGERREIAHVPSAKLTRHEIDDLYGTALVAALEAGVAVLSGPAQERVLPADVYRRIALDLASNDARVIADVSLDALRALRGGITLLRISHAELVDAGYAPGGDDRSVVEGMRKLQEQCAENVLVSRADAPALALIGDRVVEVRTPKLETADHRGAGDSMTAGLAVGIRRRLSVEETLRLGAAAGALNVTRRGLGTGRRENVEAFAARVEIRPV
jgi:1-phosphofructokinase